MVSLELDHLSVHSATLARDEHLQVLVSISVHTCVFRDRDYHLCVCKYYLQLPVILPLTGTHCSQNSVVIYLNHLNPPPPKKKITLDDGNTFLELLHDPDLDEVPY